MLTIYEYLILYTVCPRSLARIATRYIKWTRQTARQTETDGEIMRKRHIVDSQIWVRYEKEQNINTNMKIYYETKLDLLHRKLILQKSGIKWNVCDKTSKRE